MAVVGCARGERRPIVEYVGLRVFREFELAVEGVDIVPVLEDALFFGGEVDGAHCGRCVEGSALLEL